MAIFVAALNSPTDGCIVSLVVAVMRMIVIPSKQFGLVGGRMYALGKIASIKTIIASSAVSLILVSALVVPSYTLLASTQIPFFILALMCVQILLEPLTGVLYGFVKVKLGPEVGVNALFIAYLAVAVPLVGFLGLLSLSTALNVWVALFIARLIFCLLTLKVAADKGLFRTDHE